MAKPRNTLTFLASVSVLLVACAGEEESGVQNQGSELTEEQEKIFGTWAHMGGALNDISAGQPMILRFTKKDGRCMYELLESLEHTPCGMLRDNPDDFTLLEHKSGRCQFNREFPDEIDLQGNGGYNVGFSEGGVLRLLGNGDYAKADWDDTSTYCPGYLQDAPFASCLFNDDYRDVRRNGIQDLGISSEASLTGNEVEGLEPWERAQLALAVGLSANAEASQIKDLMLYGTQSTRYWVYQLKLKAKDGRLYVAYHHRDNELDTSIFFGQTTIEAARLVPQQRKEDNSWPVDITKCVTTPTSIPTTDACASLGGRVAAECDGQDWATCAQTIQEDEKVIGECCALKHASYCAR